MNRHVGLLFAPGLPEIAAMTSATIAQQPAPGGRGAAQQPVTMVFKEAWKDTSTMALKLDITKVQTKGTLRVKVDLTRVDEIGFPRSHAGKRPRHWRILRHGMDRSLRQGREARRREVIGI